MVVGTGSKRVNCTPASVVTWGLTTSLLTVFVKRTSGSQNGVTSTTLALTVGQSKDQQSSLMAYHTTLVQMARSTFVVRHLVT